MADKEQIQMLKQGVKKWNRWRAAHPNVKIDLKNVDLQDMNLSYVNLGFANLRGAFLRKTCLSGADLGEADLRGVYLSGAILDSAYLYRVKVSAGQLCQVETLYKGVFGPTPQKGIFQPYPSRICRTGAWANSWTISSILIACGPLRNSYRP